MNALRFDCSIVYDVCASASVICVIAQPGNLGCLIGYATMHALNTLGVPFPNSQFDPSVYGCLAFSNMEQFWVEMETSISG